MSRNQNVLGKLQAMGALLLFLVAMYLVYDHWRDHRFDTLIEQAAVKHHLSPFLVKAVVWRESRFDPEVRGPVDEIGLMQVRPSTAQEWARVQHVASFDPISLFDPATNLDIGCWYLRRALDRWSGSAQDPTPFALAEYNAGRSNALRWASGPQPFDGKKYITSITYPSTRRYVTTIEERCDHYTRRGRL